VTYDIAIVGAGIAGASLAAAIGDGARVLLLEAESHPGYHATGRSAAFWSETYGGPGVQPLTSASERALREAGVLDPLGELHIGRADDAAAADAFLAAFAGSGVRLDRVDPAAMVPGLLPAWTIGIHEPSCAYIARYLATARSAGATLVVDAAMRSAVRRGGSWRIETAAGPFAADVLVNAAGAWADEVAVRAGVAPIGIRPFRRTVVQLRSDPAPPARLPLVADIAGSFYFKPEAGGRLWLSPSDETPSDPCDAAVYGVAPDMPGFFWFAGQGGFGIQTSPAAAMIGAALLKGGTPADEVSGIDVARYAPARFASMPR
jgi:D-arginine dehydrogenase